MSESKIKKGDRVRFTVGIRSVQGIVKEDRGPIGIRGRHLYLVEFHAQPESPSLIELPADELVAAGRAAVAGK